MIDNYILLTEKYWHDELFLKLAKKFSNCGWSMIHSKTDFTIENIENINPKKIFIPHWSYIIPENIYSKYDCVVFHMTDLPYGRGGSPLQNLILRGHKTSKLSAIKVEKGIDTGMIYAKSSISLSGSAQEIFVRMNEPIFDIICKIIKDDLKPISQEGDIVTFKRRTPEMSNIKNIENIESLYDYIRMLDADGYPKAYLENDHFRFELFNSNINNKNQEIIANVRIIKK